MEKAWYVLGGMMIGAGAVSLIDSKKVKDDELSKLMQSNGTITLTLGLVTLVAAIYSNKK